MTEQGTYACIAFVNGVEHEIYFSLSFYRLIGRAGLSTVLRNKFLLSTPLHVTVRSLINGRIGTSKKPLFYEHLLRHSNIRQSLLRAALTPPAKQTPSKTRRSPKGGGAATNGRLRRHLEDARHGHAVVDFFLNWFRIVSAFIKTEV